MPIQAQIEANQRNAQLSTGPTSEAGKAKSSLNAVKNGLTGATVILPSDDLAAYERFRENEDEFDPAEFGFEFSFEEIEERVGLFEGHTIGCKYPDERTGRLGPVVRDEATFAKIHAAELREDREAA